MIQRSIHYKSDFKLRLANEIGWSTPFKLRFFTTRPVSAMEVGYDGTTYRGCSVDTEGKLVVTFDRFTQLHRQGLGALMMELSYNIDDDQFADRSFDRILAPQKVVCIDDEDHEFELVLGLNGDSHVEVECSVIAAYKKGDPGDTPEIGENGNWWIGGVDTEVKADYSSEEALRQSQEAARVAAETTRQSNETQRQSGETIRQSNEATRQSKETERQTNETARQNAEAQRQQTFQTNEAARQTAYQNAESNRNGAYQEAEQDRYEEFASKEATRDAANQAALDCAETLAALGPKLEDVSVESTSEGADDEQIWSDDTGTDEYAKINSNGVWGKNLKYQDGSSVKDVKTELAGKMPNMTVDSTPTDGSTNLVSSGGVANAVKPLEDVSVETVSNPTDEQAWGNDAGTDTYAKINPQGVHAKAFYKMNGQEVGGSSIPNMIVVDPSGHGDYTTIVDALNNAGDSETKHVIILVMAGTYEMPPRVSSVAPYVESNRNLTLKGVNRNKCVLTCDIGFYDYTIGTDCATLRLTGNVTIENLTIISSNEEYDNKIGTTGYVTERANRKAAYSIHLDQGRRSGDVIVVKNCKIINKQMSCIGFGLRENSTIRVENCDLECEQAAQDSEANDYGTIWGHNGSGMDVGGQRLELINNRITHKTGKRALRFSYTDAGTTTNLEISYLLVGNSVNTTDVSQSLLVNGFPEVKCVKDQLSFGNQDSNMDFSNN